MGKYQKGHYIESYGDVFQWQVRSGRQQWAKIILVSNWSCFFFFFFFFFFFSLIKSLRAITTEELYGLLCKWSQFV